MDFTPIIKSAFGAMWWIIPFLLLAMFLKSSRFKGAMGEAQVKLAAKLRLPADTYHAIHNVTLATADGSTQIDHVFVSRYGVFVVETKNMKGWIFGSKDQAQWTQKIYKNSYKIQNPLRQNYKHIKTLEAVLSVSENNIHSVIAFTGDAQFKTPMPENVTSGNGYIKYIKSFDKEVFSETQVQELIAIILSTRLAPSIKTSREHVRNLKKRNKT